MSGSELSAGFLVQFFQRDFAMSVIEFENNHRVTTKGALDGVITKSINDRITPSGKG
jgi:phospholipid N-methyltransferase